MMKIFFMILMVMPLIFMKNKYWLVQNLKAMIVFFILLFWGGAGYFMNLSYGLGGDLFSYWLVLLSGWMSLLMMLASVIILKKELFSQMFMLNLMFLFGFLVLSFISMNLMMFYLFFEASLIPTLFLILGWGYQPERVQAGIYLLFYTLFVSLPLLVGVIYVYDMLGSLDFTLLSSAFIEGELIYFSLILAFLVKMPMFLVHLWLPKAHVEAPISGSMILAGVMLKLGGYGLLRVYNMIQFKGVELNFFWVSISLVGGVLVSLVCFRQTDLKSLVAYSSVVHMGVVLSGLMTMTSWGISGAYGMMIAHGLCSSGLFCLVNIVYERLGSRSLFINKGLLMLMPSMALWWFLLCSSNMAAPPTLNLLSEIFLLNSLVSWSSSSIILLVLVSFFGAGYTLYLFSYSQHGLIYSGVFNLDSGEVREYLLLLLHWLPLNLLILNGGLVMF